MQEKIDKLQNMIEKSNRIVFFGGAGVSTESGIPDFRSKDGLYNQKYDYPPEVILSNTFFFRKTEEFYRFYKEKLNCIDYKPNITHKVLAKLEDKAKLLAVITQNIDGLHQKAGSKNVIELHGSVYRNYCIKCGKFYNEKYIFENNEAIPKCDCGGIVKPDVVLYEEPLGKSIHEAKSLISNADLLIVGGTSLTVYPAAGLVYNFKGDNLVLINKEVTNNEKIASLFIKDSLGNVFGKLKI